jgi:hypothetical protein
VSPEAQAADFLAADWRVIVRPAESGFEIELVGEIAQMVALGAGHTNTKAAPDGTAVLAYAGSVKVVAGRGFEPLTFRL